MNPDSDKKNMKNTNKPLINLIHYPVYTLGPDKRVGIWFQGCRRRCYGCMSSHTWEFDLKFSMNMEDIERIIKEFNCKRLTVSGGEPFDQPESLLNILKIARKQGYTDILLYSGYSFDILNEKYPEIISEIDVVIDGAFKAGLESDFKWKGSDNQEMHILNRDLHEEYKKFASLEKDKKLQIVKKRDMDYIIGIPYQKDFNEVKNAFL